MESTKKNVPNWRYSDEEIKSLYRNSENKKKQIKILAELNCCSIDEIKEIVGVQMAVCKP